ncbi:putative transcriptional regulator [Colwellia psychrerythraea]|uniref:Putative transcriptional regulator n=2 Tax=Colwellia psychrerythraea TaxID=28229 RepID=A0A099KFH8_COLPS|nr:putative transcriptional regulator [Colwellia psychrerythraea]
MELFDITTLEDISLLKESSELECKLAGGRDGKGAVPKDMWESYSAFANTDGGTILLGVRESKGNFSIEGIQNIEKVKAEVFNTANSNKVSTDLLSNQDVYAVDVDGKEILVIQVRRAKREERPIFLNHTPLGNSYFRKNESDQKLSDEQVKRMLAEQVNESRDSEILEHYSMDDIELDSLKVYRQTYANLNPNHSWNELSEQAFLQRIGGWRKDRDTGKEGLTLAGLLMFGNDGVIQEKLPNYMLDYQEQPADTTEQRWIDRIAPDGTWSGNLYDFSRKVYRKLIEDLKVPFSLKDGLRQDDTPVHKALREALANVLVHADYTDRASIKVIKKQDLFYFRNPGLMRVPLDVAFQGGEPDCRNRNLAKMFRFIKFGEQAGSGIPNIVSGWNSQHWQAPILMEKNIPNDQTVLELRMVDLYPKEIREKLISSYGSKFSHLTEFERSIAIIIYSVAYKSHQQLVTQTGAHTRDITLALVKLEKAQIISSSGEHKSKVYHQPDISVPTPDNVAGKLLADFLFVSNPQAANDELQKQELKPEQKQELKPEQKQELKPEQNGRTSVEGVDEKNRILWQQLEVIAKPIKEGSKRTTTKSTVRETILKLCTDRYINLASLSQLLDREPNALRRNYLNPLVAEELLSLAFPTTRNHPQQAYTKTPKGNEK